MTCVSFESACQCVNAGPDQERTKDSGLKTGGTVAFAHEGAYKEKGLTIRSALFRVSTFLARRLLEAPAHVAQTEQSQSKQAKRGAAVRNLSCSRQTIQARVR